MKVLIIGGGLSGICIAHQLVKRNIDFKIIDKGINHSTIVAAGMINPMTFRRMVKTWKGDVLIPSLVKIYTEIEETIGETFFHPVKIRRAFSTEHEKKLWEEKLTEKDFAPYMNPIANKEETPEYFKNPFGNALVNSPGYIDSKTFMKSNHDFFIKRNQLLYSTFNYEELNTEELTYKGEKYTHIVFAEGAQGEKNPFFNYLPFKNAKGEVLSLASNIFQQSEILNRKCFLLPMHNGTYRLGSTYTWGTDDPSPTEKGKKEILELYKEISDEKIEVINHEAGIRPVASDRRPFIGEHPQQKRLYIFNAMGAKGFMIAPYFSSQFVSYLFGEEKLDKEVDIRRYEGKI